jgi:hypothetical protein
MNDLHINPNFGLAQNLQTMVPCLFVNCCCFFLLLVLVLLEILSPCSLSLQDDYKLNQRLMKFQNFRIQGNYDQFTP